MRRRAASRSTGIAAAAPSKRSGGGADHRRRAGTGLHRLSAALGNISVQRSRRSIGRFAVADLDHHRPRTGLCPMFGGWLVAVVDCVGRRLGRGGHRCPLAVAARAAWSPPADSMSAAFLASAPSMPYSNGPDHPLPARNRGCPCPRVSARPVLEASPLLAANVRREALRHASPPPWPSRGRSLAA